MLCVQILSKDEIYREMLCLELRDAGYCTEGSPGLLIVDADSYSPPEGNCITFSEKEGADLLRPFDIEELLSLIRQRLEGRKDESVSNELYVSPDENLAVYRGKTVELSELEYRMLLYLYNRRGEAVSAEELALELFGDKNAKNPVRVYISYLRNKLDKTFIAGLITTCRNKGYMLN